MADAGAATEPPAKRERDAPSADGGSPGSSPRSDDLELVEIDVDVDAGGRTRGVSGINSEPFRSWLGMGGAASGAWLVGDCHKCFDGETTFWLPCDAEPKCAMEQLAAEIFSFHTRGATFDRKRSGAEWWVQVRPPGDRVGLGFHTDKDEDLVDAAGINVHPWVSTITYVAGTGAPTLILDMRVPSDHAARYASALTRAWVSRPCVGKHVAFDGRLLHGVTPELSLADVKMAPAADRITFLCNVWLNYVPIDTDRFPCPEKLEKCKLNGVFSRELRDAEPEHPSIAQVAPRVDAKNATEPPRKRRRSVRAPGQVDAECECVQWPIRTGVEHTLVLRVPKRLVGGSGYEKSSSVLLRGMNGCAIGEISVKNED